MRMEHPLLIGLSLESHICQCPEPSSPRIKKLRKILFRHSHEIYRHFKGWPWNHSWNNQRLRLIEERSGSSKGAGRGLGKHAVQGYKSRTAPWPGKPQYVKAVEEAQGRMLCWKRARTTGNSLILLISQSGNSYRPAVSMWTPCNELSLDILLAHRCNCLEICQPGTQHRSTLSSAPVFSIHIMSSGTLQESIRVDETHWLAHDPGGGWS